MPLRQNLELVLRSKVHQTCEDSSRLAALTALLEALVIMVFRVTMSQKCIFTSTIFGHFMSKFSGREMFCLAQFSSLCPWIGNGGVMVWRCMSIHGPGSIVDWPWIHMNNVVGF